MPSPGSLVLFCTAQQQDTFGTYDKSYTFTQPAVDSQMELIVWLEIYFVGCPKTEQCNQWVMDVNRCVRVGLTLHLLTIYGRFETQNVINLNMCHAPGN